MKKITILIADDHQLIRDTWTLILNSDQRFNVVAIAASGEQAIEFSRSTLPDIVLMDINMGDVNGFDATGIIKKISPGSKVIGVSMHCTPVYAKKMLRMGGSGYVTKNSGMEEFIKAILEVQQGKTYICEEVKDILVQQELESDNPKPDIGQLSKRELEVIRFIKNGFSSREIGDQLGITLKTIEVHRYNILKKLTLPNTAALVNFANCNCF